MRHSNEITFVPSYRLRLFSALAAAIATLALVIPWTVTSAEATPPGGNNTFCSNVWLQPFGQNGDRCDAGNQNWGRIMSVTIGTKERAGCVNYHGWYGEYYRSWACFGNYTEGIIYINPNDTGSYIGIIRNNNLSYGGRFSGTFYCCR